MQEIIVPEDGLVYKTAYGDPIMQISVINEARVLSLFSKHGQSNLTLACHDAECAIHVGNFPIGISLIVKDNENVIRFVNNNKKLTNLFCATEDGGQIELFDDNNNPLLSLGLNEGGIASIFLRDRKGTPLVSIWQNNGKGSVDIQDSDKNPIWSSSFDI